MYSYEDRIRAVKFYIKLGKRLRATIRLSSLRLGGLATANLSDSIRVSTKYKLLKLHS